MRIRIGVSLFFALIAGIGVSSQWNHWVLFTHYQSFHQVDPQFHKDIGFYVFQLPFLKFIAEWLFAGLVIVLIVTAVVHYLNGGIRLQSPFQRVTPQVKAHLSVILAVMALVKTAQYYLGRFELNFSTRGVVEGASYTDVKAQLPALNLLIFISIGAAGLFLWNIRRRGWVLPIIAVGLWAFVLARDRHDLPGVHPAVPGRAERVPGRGEVHRPQHPRDARRRSGSTRSDREVRLHVVGHARRQRSDRRRAEQPEHDQQRAVVGSRLSSGRTTATNQNLQTYYQIGDVDVDRYLVDGKVQQVLHRGARAQHRRPPVAVLRQPAHRLHPRLRRGRVAEQRGRAVGEPRYLLKDVPTGQRARPRERATVADLLRREPQQLRGHRHASQREFDYQREGATDKFTRYKGKDGVKLSNFVRRAAFALRFGSLDPLISGRSIRTRSS